jgi:glycosyltransferase involved in cell wall biosynthesis
MRILVVHQHYLVPGMPGGSRFNEMARIWSGMGHTVGVIAGTLNYASGQTPPRYQRRWVTRERDGEVTVWRCHVPSSYSRGYAGRMWAFLAFTLSSATAVLRTGRNDIVIATSPPLTAFISGWLAARLPGRRAPWIAEVRDLWPESAVTTGVLRAHSPLARLLYRLERWAYRRADAISVLTPAFKQDIASRRLAPPAKIAVIPNGADLRLFQPGARENHVRREHGWGERFVVMYCGAHGRANAVGQLIGAAELLRSREDILIACVGDGPERANLEEQTRSRGLANIRFLGPQPKEAMPAFVQACDAGAAVLQNNPTFRTVYPNKVFDYMACARPTLLAIDGVARELVCEQARAGVFAAPEDPRALADAILGLADHPEECRRMGENGLGWVRANASREDLARKYLELMESLVARWCQGGARVVPG